MARPVGRGVGGPSRHALARANHDLAGAADAGRRSGADDASAMERGRLLGNRGPVAPRMVSARPVALVMMRTRSASRGLRPPTQGAHEGIRWRSVRRRRCGASGRGSTPHTPLKYANKVEISLSKKNTNLFIIIDDDGPGIPKDEYENVFKPFYKIDKGRADSKSSVGLGLSISSDIIKSHGGNIMLEKSKMDGLRVKIFLPV